MHLSAIRTTAVALLSIFVASTAIATAAQAQSGRYYPRTQERPRVNEPGVLCRTKLVRKCTTHRGRTYCKPTWQRVCRQVERQ